MNVIEINHLTKSYGKNRGVIDVSLTVEQGDIFGFLGPNGAGKSTTIRSMLGFLRFHSGEIKILG
ncbi:MAG: ATP-binding cassette domain-containing protein, partial [Lachnospiraceae bacterium]|nr:ATP-binding cassette domain-containing protein [Lachnospiraceae bacterium]